MSQVLIRAAKQSDVEPLVEIIQFAFRGGKKSDKVWTGEAHLVSGPRITPEKLQALLEQKNGQVLVAEIQQTNGQPRLIGCIHVERENENDAHVAMLAVDPDEQASGAGRILMTAAEDYARGTFRSKRMVGDVISGRPELMSWYLRLGYTTSGETKPFFGPEHGVTPKVEGLHFVVIEKALS